MNTHTTKNITRLASILLILLAGIQAAYAANKQFTLTERYYLGDGDSHATARNLLIEQIRNKAANLAGSYIQAKKTLKNNRLSENIQILSASIIHIKVLNERMGFTHNKRFFLEIKARATVNTSELKKRIKAMQSDRKKDKQIKKLNQKNRKLKQQLQTLRQALKQKNLSRKKVTQLLEQQNDLLDQVQHNRKQAARIFKRGTLLAMAQQQDDQAKQALKAHIKHYYRIVEDSNTKVEIVSLKNRTLLLKVRVKDKLRQLFPCCTNQYDLEKQPEKLKKLFYDFGLYINQNPVWLVIQIDDTEYQRIPYFGLFELDFFGKYADTFTKAKPEQLKEFKQAILYNGYSQRAIDYNRYKDKLGAWYAQKLEKQDYSSKDIYDYYFIIPLSQAALEEASSIRAYLEIAPRKAH